MRSNAPPLGPETDRLLPEDIHRCRLLIDGYNLLFAMGLAQPGKRAHRTLQKAREALLQKLAEKIPNPLRFAVWIVFDAFDAPKNLPDMLASQGMNVFFSRHWVSADEMMQAIISRHSNPKSLWVISSDHAVQRKAITRGAAAIDSEEWSQAIERLLHSLEQKQSLASEEDPKPFGEGISSSERDEWLRRFGFPAKDA